MIEFHAILWMFDDSFQYIESAYSREEPYVMLSETYTDAKDKEQYEEITWNHGLSKVFQGLLNNNMQIIDFEEHDYSPYNLFDNMSEDNGKFRITGMENLIPLLFSIVAEKK